MGGVQRDRGALNQVESQGSWRLRERLERDRVGCEQARAVVLACERDGGRELIERWGLELQRELHAWIGWRGIPARPGAAMTARRWRRLCAAGGDEARDSENKARPCSIRTQRRASCPSGTGAFENERGLHGQSLCNTRAKAARAESRP